MASRYLITGEAKPALKVNPALSPRASLASVGGGRPVAGGASGGAGTDYTGDGYAESDDDSLYGNEDSLVQRAPPVPAAATAGTGPLLPCAASLQVRGQSEGPRLMEGAGGRGLFLLLGTAAAAGLHACTHHAPAFGSFG